MSLQGQLVAVEPPAPSPSALGAPGHLEFGGGLQVSTARGGESEQKSTRQQLRGARVRKPALLPDPWLWLPAFEDACSGFFFAFNDVVNMLILLYELCGHSARLLIWKLLSP